MSYRILQKNTCLFNLKDIPPADLSASLSITVLGKIRIFISVKTLTDNKNNAA